MFGVLDTMHAYQLNTPTNQDCGKYLLKSADRQGQFSYYVKEAPQTLVITLGVGYEKYSKGLLIIQK